MIEKSCGTIPYIIENGIIYYLLIQTKNYGEVGFPKGHVEEGESEIQTATRETWEETSIKLLPDKDFRYEFSYYLPNGKQKTVVYFLAKFQNQNPKRNENFESFNYFLLPFAQAYEKLSFENTRAMLKAANTFLTKSNTTSFV